MCCSSSGTSTGLTQRDRCSFVCVLLFVFCGTSSQKSALEHLDRKALEINWAMQINIERPLVCRTFYFCFTGGVILKIFQFEYWLRRGFADLDISARSHVWQSGLFSFNLAFHLPSSWSTTEQVLLKEVIRLSQCRAGWGGMTLGPDQTPEQDRARTSVKI